MANISKIKLPNNDTAYDIKDTVSGYTTNTGTVTSVRVQATSPVQSSVSTAQSASLNTTISLANGYGDTKNPYASKTKNYVLAAPSTANGVPVFRALTAADIPDLSSIYLTSYTDEKVKTEDLPTDNTPRSLIIKSTNSTPSTATAFSSVEYQAQEDSSASKLCIGRQKRGEIRLGYTSGSSLLYTDLKTSHTAARTITLPDKNGTVALTSDIVTYDAMTNAEIDAAITAATS